MIQKIEPYRLWDIYKEVHKFGIPFLETMTDYEILQIREFAYNVFKGGEESAFKLFSAYLNSNSDYLKQIPEEYKSGREIEYIGLKHVNHYYEAVHVLKIIERYFESKQKQIKSDEISIKKFSDILEDKYKNKEDDIFAVLGKSFPEFYNEKGKALNNKKSIKAILNSWYKLLFEFNIISLNPTKPQKEQICKVLLERCKFSDNILTSKTLFENEGIEVKFKPEYVKLKNLIKELKTN